MCRSPIARFLTGLHTYLFAALLSLLTSCSPDVETNDVAVQPSYPAVTSTFAGRINLNNPINYAGQTRPGYIARDQLAGQSLSNLKVTLGRVLFYDRALSNNNTVSCASCHQQRFAFSDTARASVGVNGTTGRHSMRLVNARFAAEPRFFWDERATSLANQTTQPIRDAAEMGFSGTGGQPSFNALLTKLGGRDYYQELFTATYGDPTVTEARLQEALSQFIFSIQSFDSRYDSGRAQVANDGAPFPNFTAQENQGKQLFLTPPVFGPGGLRTGGGLGCQPCHRAPEFDIDPNSRNNGFVLAFGGGTDLSVTRSPSLRDLVRADGGSNGGFFHSGGANLAGMIQHYNVISDNANLDPRLRPGGNPQRLQLTNAEREAVEAFLRTLSGTSVYTDARWSNPFPN